LAKKEVLVKFKTITPLWTGDAWQNNSEIRPSSLIGSLRFWFEVICYFSRICDEDDFNKKSGRFEKEVDRDKFKKCLVEKGNSFEAKIECLLEQNIPLPSIIFGTTNWRSLVEIKDIKYLEDYCFGNKLNLPTKICFNKSTYEIKENRDCPPKSNNNWSVFFFAHPYFYGKLQVVFKVEEKILESIFYPLLTFMDKYGFWGGKWNIGYGRLKILEVKTGDKLINNWEKDTFLFSQINEEWVDKKLSDLLLVVTNFRDLTQQNSKIRILEDSVSNSSFINLIKKLIKEKSKQRANFNTNKELRHKIFGKTGNTRDLSYVPQGSKILPFIYYEEQGQLKGGFLSIAGLLNLEGISDE